MCATHCCCISLLISYLNFLSTHCFLDSCSVSGNCTLRASSSLSKARPNRHHRDCSQLCSAATNEYQKTESGDGDEECLTILQRTVTRQGVYFLECKVSRYGLRGTMCNTQPCVLRYHVQHTGHGHTDTDVDTCTSENKYAQTWHEWEWAQTWAQPHWTP